jgi:hypothetical protein
LENRWKFSRAIASTRAAPAAATKQRWGNTFGVSQVADTPDKPKKENRRAPPEVRGGFPGFSTIVSVPAGSISYAHSVAEAD